MARNEINLDQINARLRGNSTPSNRYDEEDEAGDEPPFGGDDGGDDSSNTMNAGFIATVFALFVAVFGGTYYFSDGVNFSKISNINWGWKTEAAPVFLASSVDEECKMKEWQPDTMNNNIVHCYLTVSQGRLCSPNERQALVATLMRFQDDSDAFDGNLFLASAGMAVNTPMADKMQLGLEAAKADTAKSPEEAMKHEENAAAIAQGMMSDVNKVMKNQVYINYQVSSLQDSLQKLGEKGLISLDEFPSKHPDWVTEALQDVKVNAPSCH